MHPPLLLKFIFSLIPFSFTPPNTSSRLTPARTRNTQAQFQEDGNAGSSDNSSGKGSSSSSGGGGGGASGGVQGDAALLDPPRTPATPSSASTRSEAEEMRRLELSHYGRLARHILGLSVGVVRFCRVRVFACVRVRACACVCADVGNLVDAVL